MRLFNVPEGCRVRIKSELVRWINHRAEEIIYRDLIFEATTTDCYFYYRGARRRLLIDHTIPKWQHYGVWQRDTECKEIIMAEDKKKRVEDDEEEAPKPRPQPQGETIGPPSEPPPDPPGQGG